MITATIPALTESSENFAVIILNTGKIAPGMVRPATVLTTTARLDIKYSLRKAGMVAAKTVVSALSDKGYFAATPRMESRLSCPFPWIIYSHIRQQRILLIPSTSYLSIPHGVGKVAKERMTPTMRRLASSCLLPLKSCRYLWTSGMVLIGNYSIVSTASVRRRRLSEWCAQIIRRRATATRFISGKVFRAQFLRCLLV